MKPRPEMSWTCPACQARNATIMAAEIEAGKIVEVSCESCGEQQEASVFFRDGLTEAPFIVGIVWV